MKLVPYRRTLAPSFAVMNDMIDDFFKSGMDNAVYDSFKVDVEKEKDKYIVTADLPGVAKENLDVDVEEGVLTIAVHQEEDSEEKDKEKNYLHRERRITNSSRRIRLGDIDEDAIKANLENGVLRIELPFAPEVTKKKSIDIQ